MTPAVIRVNSQLFTGVKALGIDKLPVAVGERDVGAGLMVLELEPRSNVVQDGAIGDDDKKFNERECVAFRYRNRSSRRVIACARHKRMNGKLVA